MVTVRNLAWYDMCIWKQVWQNGRIIHIKEKQG